MLLGAGLDCGQGEVMRLFTVMSVNKTVDVEMMGFKRTEPLSFAPGMVGAMPVFDTKESAERFSEGKFKIAEIEVQPQ